jgi:hypothetical protein
MRSQVVQTGFKMGSSNRGYADGRQQSCRMSSKTEGKALFDVEEFSV